MLEYQGKYGKAKVMIDKVDSTTISQLYDMLNHEAFTNPIAVMPDCHAGKGAVIGFTMPLTDKVIPNIVGVDIGCGMLSLMVELDMWYRNGTWAQIDEKIRNVVPFGTNAHKGGAMDTKDETFWHILSVKLQYFTRAYNERYNTAYAPTRIDRDGFVRLCKKVEMDPVRAFQSIGTLGGGNHFIEIGINQVGKTRITFHSGSRQFGLKVATYHQRKAGKGQMAYLTGDDAYNYLRDMIVAQEYADLNRRMMARLVIDELELYAVKGVINTVHNFIDFNDWIIRKGAIRSYKEMDMVIPWNMEDGITICRGKSNPEWNFSAPHGAGRIGSRSWAKKNLSNRDAQRSMRSKGIFYSKLPTDELKGAYKDPKVIEAAIEPTAEILDRFTPIVAMKE